MKPDNLSSKLFTILNSKTTLSYNELCMLTEGQGWEIVYSMAKPKTEKKLTICFTGFLEIEKLKLSEIAKESNMQVSSGVTASLKLLCCGENPGAKKLEAAKVFNTQIINNKEFLDLIDSNDLKQQ